MPYLLNLEIHGLPETMNQMFRMKLRERMSRKKYWKETVWASVQGKKPPRPIFSAKLTLTRCSTTRPDQDNLASSFKHVIDGLVISGVLQNDKHENIGAPEYLWEKAAAGKGRIRVHLVEVTE